MAVDWSDPCARHAALRTAYYELVSGGKPVRVKFGDREVWYNPETLSTLKSEMEQAAVACAALTTGAARRFSITAGSRRGPSVES